MNTITLPEELPLNSSLSISVFNYESRKEISKQQILLNKHTFSFLQEGTKEVFFDNSTYEIDNTQFLLMKSGHCLMTEKLSNDVKYYKSILFFFSTEDVFNFLRKFELNTRKPVQNYSTYSFGYDTFIKRFVDSLVDISTLTISLQQKLLKTKFEEIMLYLMDAKGGGFLYSLISNTNDNQKFIQTIESNRLNKLTIKELSFLSNMSVSTFKREFEKHFNSSPSKWFQDKRLEHSAYLLKNEAKRPSDIFEEIGYENLSNFIQAFKAKFGITPKQHQSS
ncbi:AraC family transcriptional regulator [Flammeovirga pectinis]|uniref:AraC family transcriptional regulator n=1 Tax=Flammeovirga pectinis TaxID=2494373 RepID=A0A3Q9FS27_9BACT|nr:AraC family transcriptional regulator [Flammeovirga pectinis]AZQ64741.1 AraC family transcriptional regulator [Flammeovirga pectinis]